MQANSNSDVGNLPQSSYKVGLHPLKAAVIFH